MFKISKRFAPAAGVLVIALLGSAAAPQLLAQDAAPAEQPAEASTVDPLTVIATVNGEEITEAELSLLSEDVSQQLQQMPPEERRPFLVRMLIEAKLMAAAAKEQGMDADPLFQQRLSYLEDQALRQAYLTEVLTSEVTPEAIQALYDEFVADFEPEPQVRARHILVETEEEARQLKSEIEGGADFAALAEEHSIDQGSAVRGGDLGSFTRDRMVEPFAEAAFALEEAGDVSEPVETQFGWHIIKLEEKGQSSPPAMEQVAQELQQQVMFRAYDNSVDALMEGANVEIPDPELAAAVEAQKALEEGAKEGMNGAAPAEETVPAEEAAPAEGTAPAEEAPPAQ